MATTHRRWRDADLAPLGVDAIPAAAADADALTIGLRSVAAVRAGEGFLKWQQLQNIADMLEAKISMAVDSMAGGSAVDEFDRYLDPQTQLVASLATVLSVGKGAAENLLNKADALRNRVPNAGILLRDGIIGYTAFGEIVAETAAVIDPYLLAKADREIADDVRSSGNVGFYDVRAAARSIVAAIDAEAARTARDKNKPTRGIQIYPAGPGLATLAITNTVENIAKAEAVINHLVETEVIEEDDRRTKAERRSDAAIAVITDPDTDNPGARLVVHVIADGSTLDGGDKPGHLEGQGAIDAGHVRDIAADPSTLIRDLDLTRLTHGSAQAADPYRPTALLDTVVRGLFPRCSWPGCSVPARRCDLDHVAEYDHTDPAAGGQTSLENLNPKCRFHHLLKTFGEGWLDDQIIDAHGVVWTEVTTPEGFTMRSKAPNTWLLPDAGLIPQPPPTTVATAAPPATQEPTRWQTRTEAKHAYRHRLRAQRRSSLHLTE